jgi:uncharacterized phage protein gp47/JayE
MLLVYATRAQGGSAADFLQWARETAGVTRAWVVPHGVGAGSVWIYVMLDAARSSNAGFPVGTDGGSASDSRVTAATGDQLAVADHIYPLQPVPCVVYVSAPTPAPVAFTIDGFTTASTAMKSAVTAALSATLTELGTVGAAATSIAFSELYAAVSSVPGVPAFRIANPTTNVSIPAGSLATLGTVTWGTGTVP